MWCYAVASHTTIKFSPVAFLNCDWLSKRTNLYTYVVVHPLDLRVPFKHRKPSSSITLYSYTFSDSSPTCVHAPFVLFSLSCWFFLVSLWFSWCFFAAWQLMHPLAQNESPLHFCACQRPIHNGLSSTLSLQETFVHHPLVLTLKQGSELFMCIKRVDEWADCNNHMDPNFSEVSWGQKGFTENFPETRPEIFQY